jgi:hypothetical protein
MSSNSPNLKVDHSSPTYKLHNEERLMISKLREITGENCRTTCDKK